MLNKYSEWVKKQCRFASYDEAPTEGESLKPIHNYVQWMTSDNRHFFPATRVVKNIPPGYYSKI